MFEKDSQQVNYAVRFFFNIRLKNTEIPVAGKHPLSFWKKVSNDDLDVLCLYEGLWGRVSVSCIS